MLSVAPMPVPTGVTSAFAEVLASQIGQAAVSRIPEDRLRQLEVAIGGASRPGRQERELWCEVIAAADVEWSAAYLDYLQRRTEGRSMRLGRLELLVEALLHAVSRKCWLQYQHGRVYYERITPFVMFRAELANCDDACRAVNFRYWPLAQADVPRAMVMNCKRPDCMCAARPCRGREIEFFRSQGETVVAA